MIECRNIAKNYGTLNAVSDISLHLREKEFISILGPKHFYIVCYVYSHELALCIVVQNCHSVTTSQRHSHSHSHSRVCVCVCDCVCE